MNKRQEVVDLLSLFKGAIRLGHSRVRWRQKNTQALIDLGITPNERKEILLGLVPEDYVAGPMPDDSDSGKEVWVFGKKVEGTETYIKIGVTQNPKRKSVYEATILSFHPAEFPMRYPLKGGGA